MPRQKTNNISTGLWLSVAMTRILLGLIFLWAFFDKLLGLNFSTQPAHAWLHGGSPTTGFLSHVDGTFAGFFNTLAGNPVVDVLFMLGLLGVGLGLLFGIAMRLSILAGMTMLFLMWMASLPLETNPLIDDHIVYIAVLAVLWFELPFQRLSAGYKWRTLSFVRSNRWLA